MGHYCLNTQYIISTIYYKYHDFLKLGHSQFGQKSISSVISPLQSRVADPDGADLDPDPDGADLDPDPTTEKQPESRSDLIKFTLTFSSNKKFKLKLNLFFILPGSETLVCTTKKPPFATGRVSWSHSCGSSYFIILIDLINLIL